RPRGRPPGCRPAVPLRPRVVAGRGSGAGVDRTGGRPDGADGTGLAEAVTPKRWEDPGAQDGPKPQRTRDADETKPERDLPLVGPPPPPPPPSPPGRQGAAEQAPGQSGRPVTQPGEQA